MALRVFLSYSLHPGEVPLAWRLQTLAAAHGIEMYVPNHAAAAGIPAPTSTQRAIDRADCVLAIITTAPSATVQDQLRYALKKRKLVIPIVRAELHPVPLIARLPRTFTFSPSDDPGTIETQINQFLKDQQVAKEEQQAIGALAALGLGLLTLVSLNKE